MQRAKTQFLNKKETAIGFRMKVDKVQLGIIAVLFLMFMAVPQITETMGRSLDTLPMRIAAVLIVLAALPYDKFVALGVFLIVTAVYIQHHQHDLAGVTGPAKFKDLGLVFDIPKATLHLDKGGKADETFEANDFVPRSEDQDNEFTGIGQSLDEKQVLVSETLGSRAQSIFNDDMRHAEALAHGNRNGAHD
jgi:hypothetical protein